MISRRKFVSNATAFAAVGWVRFMPTRSKAFSLKANPFPLGIASGDPVSDSVILWTRVASDLAPTAPGDSVCVRWRLARDNAMRDVVVSGSVIAKPDNAHCVHVLAKGLESATTYFYQFEVFGVQSEIGRTRTLPEPDARLDRFSIAMSSCQEYSSGFFSAYKDLVAKQPDLVLHNGDYIYETAAGSVRPYPFEGEAMELDQYRALYALYRQDYDLREAHRLFPWIVIWDDHEVVNDWGPNHFIPSPYNKQLSLERHSRRVAAGKRAFLEHLPLRASLSLYDDTSPQLYKQDVIGDLVELTRLDVRSQRDEPVCNEGNTLEFVACPALGDTQRSMLGRNQEEWFASVFGRSKCRWSCIAQTTILAPFDRAPGPAKRYESESWDNYPHNRARLLASVKSKNVRNPISLGGNIHAYYAGVVSDDLEDGQGSEPVMSEIVTSSISAGGGDSSRYNDVNGRRQENPGIRFFDNRSRGYTHLTFERDRVIAEFRAVSQIDNPDGEIETLASIVVRDGTIEPEVNESGDS